MKFPKQSIHAFLLLPVLLPIGRGQRAGAADLPSRPSQPTSGSGSFGLPDDDGCTRTQGYWKNHSAHAENRNQNIPWPISEETLLCGETWFDILHTPPSGGNAWIILAHQWIAAKLNAASGASTDVLGDALDRAEDLLSDHCGGLSGDDRDRAIDLASRLEDYNSGDIGPGHCDEIVDCNDNGIDDATDIDNGTSPDQNEDGIPDECQSKIIYYCQGNPQDGGGVACPCGNTVPSGTMAGCLNRNGNGASLQATGIPSVSNDTLVLTATGLPLGVPGFFFQGDGGLARVNTGNGVRCIDHFIRMRKIVHSTGGDTIPVPGGPSISEEFHITAGATKYYQVLYRDNGGPCGGAVNATNVVQIVWGL